MQYGEFFEYLNNTQERILSVVESSDVSRYFHPEDISDGAFSYIRRRAKRLRPSVLLMSAGALGGPERERLALPAAAGVELFHTWTLVHDDVIDNDTLRRGESTVHESMRKLARSRDKLSDPLSIEYGRDVAILTGDIQHGWSIALFVDCALKNQIDSTLILKLIKYLQSYVLGNLIGGELLDVQYGMRDLSDLEDIGEEEIINMLRLKTGILYEFAGMAGALIGKNTDDFEDSDVQAVMQFAGKCGTAFQLQDDILGIVGDKASLGKPVGSDIREGKKTVIVHESLRHASDSQRDTILSTLGNRSATEDEIDVVTRLFSELNGIQKTKDLAARYIEEALPHMNSIPDSKYKELLILWAHYMLDRQF